MRPKSIKSKWPDAKGRQCRRAFYDQQPDANINLYRKPQSLFTRGCGSRLAYFPDTENLKIPKNTKNTKKSNQNKSEKFEYEKSEIPKITDNTKKTNSYNSEKSEYQKSQIPKNTGNTKK